MTGLGLPSQGAALSAGAAAANANALVGDRGAGKSPDANDSSVFIALLDSAAAPAHPASGNAPPIPQAATAAAGGADASLASISAIHSLGSGVLVALDKQLTAATTQKEAPATPAAPKTADGNVDMTALTNLGWAALIMSATGAAPAPTTASAPQGGAKTAAGATGAAAVAQVGKATADRIVGDPKIQMAMPSDAAATNTLQPIALTAGTAPVDVKVVRSITYLGLDPTVRDSGAPQGSAAASPRAGAATSGATGGGRGGLDGNAPLAPVGNTSGGGASTMSGEEQSRRGLQNAGKSQHAAESAAAAKPSPPGADAPGVAMNGATGVTQPGLGAISANGLPNIPVSQLADVIANAAQSLGAQSSDTSAPVRTANGTSLASMAPVKELDVQLNPASLGALSIEMRLSNGALSVTIKADKSDTLKLIENERSAISDKLKSLNFSVESLNVKALDAAAPTSASGEASNSGTTGYGEAQQGQKGQTADGSPGNGRSLQGGGEQGRPRPQERGVLGDSGDDRNLGHRFV